MSLKQRRTRNLLVVTVIGVFLVLCYASIGWVEFACLRTFRDEDRMAKILANRLMLSRAGVKRSLQDIDCFGGSTGGWSSQILVQSPRRADVEDGLREIFKNKNERLSRRIEAADLLWIRTKDKARLSDLFQLVENPGPTAVALGRRDLVVAINGLDVLINENEDASIGISFAQFDALLKDQRPR